MPSTAAPPSCRAALNPKVRRPHHVPKPERIKEEPSLFPCRLSPSRRREAPAVANLPCPAVVHHRQPSPRSIPSIPNCPARSCCPLPCADAGVDQFSPCPSTPPPPPSHPLSLQIVANKSGNNENLKVRRRENTGQLQRGNEAAGQTSLKLLGVVLENQAK